VIEEKMFMNLEESYISQNKELSRHLPGDTERNHENSQPRQSVTIVAGPRQRSYSQVRVL
jgi:hypothetical protein